MHLKRLLTVLIFSISILSAQGKATDDRIYDQVRMKLAADPVAGRGNVDVEVREGVVTLKGKVHSDKQKQKAGKLASKVKGVSNVVNQLQVDP